MRPEIRTVVKDIRADREKGARQLALAALEALRSVAADCSGQEFRDCARALALARPMMAAIENALAAAWSRYLETGDAAGAVTDTVELIELAPDEMEMAARKVISADTVMTYSYSSTVIELLSRLRPRRVIVSEARPLNEGLRTARQLVSAGVSATMITESQMALFVHEADTVVVGADTIFPDGDFTNRMGTRLLALAARDAEVPFYALSETLKVAAPSQPLPFAPEEGEPKEVCPDQWLEVRNVCYELIPARLLSAYVTEQGLLDPGDVQRYAAEADRRWLALMNGAEG